MVFPVSCNLIFALPRQGEISSNLSVCLTGMKENSLILFQID